MLDKYRSEIDELDREIIQLLDKRFAVTTEVGAYKKANGIAIINQQREDIIITKIKSMDLKHEAQVIETYQALMEISKKYQDE